MKKLFISIMFLTCINVAYSQVNKEVNLNLTAGDHLIKATKKYNTALIFYGAGIIFSTVLPLAGDMDIDERMPMLVIGGMSVLIGFSLNISAWQQFGKAGKKLNKF